MTAQSPPLGWPDAAHGNPEASHGAARSITLLPGAGHSAGGGRPNPGHPDSEQREQRGHNATVHAKLGILPSHRGILWAQAKETRHGRLQGATQPHMHRCAGGVPAPSGGQQLWQGQPGPTLPDPEGGGSAPPPLRGAPPPSCTRGGEGGVPRAAYRGSRPD